MIKLITIFLIAGLASTTLFSQNALKYPKTRKVDTVDNYFGTKVADPYRWLEDDQSPEVKKWVQEENKVTFDYLSKIPFRSQIKERLTKLINYPKYTSPFKEGNKYFYYKNDGLQNQSVLYIQDNLDSEPRVFLDPNKLSSDGTVALSDVAVSKDGKYLAYSTAASGSDWNEIFLMDVNSRKKLDDHIKWIKFSGISWLKDGFFYSRYDEPVKGSELTKSNEYQKVFYHKAGTAQNQDSLVYEDKTQPKRNFGASVTEDERFLMLYMSEGATNNNALWVKDLKNNSDFIKIVDNFENEYTVIDDIGDKLLVLTNKNAPKKKVVLIDPTKPEMDNWKDIIPENGNPLEFAQVVGNKIIAGYMEDANSHCHIYDLDGKAEGEIKLPALGSVSGFSGKKNDDIAFYEFSSFTYPKVVYQFNTKTKESKVFRKPEMDFNFDDYETEEVFYSSKDGTKVPMFIVHKKGMKMDGNNPCLLYAYGGFNISMTPGFSASRLLLLENGGIYAQPSIRGGSEYGEDWHKAGMLDKKQNVFDDFIAAAEYLIDKKYTSKEKLACMGGSNGGLLIGAVINQRPDLFRVAFPEVGVMDMLRFQKFTIGWAWVPEYGSSDNPEQFKYLIKYSPIHNIRSGVNYPATMVTTADHDDRVVPAHSFKYIATLQEKYKGPNPVIIRIETKAGHGAGKPTAKIIDEQTDIYSFLFYNMGVKLSL